MFINSISPFCRGKKIRRKANAIKINTSKNILIISVMQPTIKKDGKRFDTKSLKNDPYRKANLSHQISFYLSQLV